MKERLLPIGFSPLVLMFFFAFMGANAQTQLIPASDGAFNSGATFAANGWTVANQGTGMIKWAVGPAVNSGLIAGNSAYVSVDNGETNSAAGVPGARAVYFYRDIVIPAGQTNIALSFNWKSVGTTWQVYVAPTSVTPVGGDVAQSTIAGATLLLTGTNMPTTQNAFSFIPPSFAGTTARLIFMWSNSNGGGVNPPAAIDNISVVSRVGGAEIGSVATGNFTNPSTWDSGYVPSPADDVVINSDHTVTIDAKGVGANNLYIAGSNAVLQFAAIGDEFTVANDLLISGAGCQFKVYEAATGKSLRVGHDISVLSGGRLDVSVGSTGTNAGALTLFGSTLQTVAVDATSFIGGTVTATGTTNTAGVFNQLNISNTSTATPNIDWQVNNIRIKSALRLNSGRIALGSNKIIIGNYGQIFSNNFICNLGSGFIGGTISRWYGSSTGTVIDPGIDFNPNTGALFPSLSATGANRWAFINAGNATTQGEVAMTYTDATSVTTGLSIADGSYTITDRYNGNWAISTAGSTYVNTAATFSLGLYAVGAYAANDGSSRIMNAASAVPGTHINGTTTPFIARSGMTLADLTAAPLYVGINNGSVPVGTPATTIASGNWNNPVVWSTGTVPTCGSIATIASGHTITVDATASVTGLTINAGGTLINAAGTMTVGCTNNNAVFTNLGTHTVSGGTLTVNGGVYHRTGSTFNHTGGDIIVDSNAAGNAVNSVGQGGSAFKLDTSNLNLAGGKITIVDPLVNNTVATTATSVLNFTADTLPGTFTQNFSGAAGQNVITTNANNVNMNCFGVGQSVSGPGIAPGTVITDVTAVIQIAVTLSQPTTALINTASGALTFTSMQNGQKNIVLPNNATLSNIAPGQTVTGPGIQPGTTVVNSGASFSDTKGGVTLSLPVLGLSPSPNTSAQTMTFSGASNGSATIILPAANPGILVGQAVSGTGIQNGTTVAAINGARIDLSLPATSAMTAPAALTFFDGNLNSYAFAYNSPNHYVAGLNHTLQIGDGLSTDKGAVTTNGFLCNMAQGTGVLSLGNLTVDAADGANRFFNITGNLNVQNTTTITANSVFKRYGTSGGWYFGGNIVNNGTVLATVGPFLSNYINGAAVPTTLPQTISGTGTFYNNLNPALATGSFSALTVNNTSPSGVTINTQNFRISGSITMTAGIIHTSALTPLQQGVLDLSIGNSITGNFGPNCYIDGPFMKTLPLANTANYLFPVGKAGAYTPISMSQNGGAIFTAEAFPTNSGTASANISGLSQTRWKLTRQGTAGTFVDFKISLGDAPVTANHIAVQAATDQGTYDNVLGTTATFTPAAAVGTINTIAMPTATLGSSFTGFFAYALGAPNCTTVNPGNTIASANNLCATQQVTLSLETAAIGTGVTYQWQSSADGVTFTNIANATSATYLATPTAATYYQAIVTCPFGPVTATSTPVLITFSTEITGTTSATSCVPGTVDLEASAATGTINWYAAATGGASLATGTTFTTPSLATTTTYYAATETASLPYVAGPAFAGTQTQTTAMSGLVFNASTNLRLASVKVYPKQTTAADVAPITIKLFDKNGIQVPGTTVTFTPSVNTGTVGTVSDIVPLNYNIPAGTGYRLLATYGLSSANALGRLGSATYPINLNGISITASASDFVNNGTNYPNFFELNIVDVCASPRVAVVATIGCQDCATVGTAVTTPVTCFAGNNGTAVVTMSDLTPSLDSISYTVDGGTSQAATLVSGAFTINGLTAGTHSVVVSNAGCPDVAVSVAVAGPSAPLTNVTTATACGTYTWSVTGLTYITGGTYTGTTTNGDGCTVNETLDLTITPITSNTTTETACDSYTWAVNGTVYTDSGTYTSVTGCHTETLELTITPSTSNTTTVTACDSYTWTVNGTVYTESGTYTSVTECHTETLELTITPSTSNTTIETACDTYTWAVNGTVYTESGTYTSVTECHTETLELTITPSTSNTTVATACDSYTWTVNGTVYTDSGTYTLVTGCHTETLELTINSAAVPTGEATQTISVTDANDATLEDLVVSPADVVWYASSEDALNQVNPLAITTVLDNGATYYAVNVSSGCASAPFAVTVDVTLGVGGFDDSSFGFYPNPTSGLLNISYSEEITNVCVVNMIGQTLLNVKSNQNVLQIDLSSLPTATYFVKVESNGNSKVVKVIKQ